VTVFQHETVMGSEVCALLAPRDGGLYLDCTLGGGGHAERLLEASGPTGRVIGLDRDPNALAAASARLAGFGERFVAVRSTFGALQAALAEAGVSAVDGLVADLGVSSPQLDQAARGFSFMRDGPLDMRMDPDAPTTAAELVNGLPEAELADLLYGLGEERQSRRLARAIVAARPITGTAQLAQVIAGAMGGPRDRIHPATRSFQALRLAVNDELGELDRLLAALPGCLTVGGRAAVISFHSLEDRRVKQRFRALAGLDAEKDAYGRSLGVPTARLITKKAVEDSGSGNPRARSAKLRVIERV